MADIGQRAATNPNAQIAVGRGFAEVGAAERGIPFAERGLLLAEKSGDRRLIDSALTSAAVVYEKAGRYEEATARAKRALELNPKNAEARMIYMTSKDRASGRPAAPAGAGAAAAAAQAGAREGEGGRRRSMLVNSGGIGRAQSTVAMTPAEQIRLQKTLSEARRLMALDAKTALRHFDAAVKSAPGSGSVRAERATARLAVGDAQGALEDAEAAVAGGGGAAAFAIRGQAKRALGRAATEVLADYAAAAERDPLYARVYQDMLAKLDAKAGEASRSLAGQASALDAAPGRRTPAGKGWLRLAALLGAAIAAAGVMIALLVPRRKNDSPSSGRTPAPR